MVNYDFLYDKRVFDAILGMDHQKDLKLYFSEYFDTCIEPKKEEEYWYSRNGFKDDAFFCKRRMKPEEYDIEKADVIFLGTLYPVWGHWITDNLSRFWFLFSEPYRKHYKEYKIVYVMEGDQELHENVKMFLRVLGIEPAKLIRLKRNTCFRKIIFPNNCFYRDVEKNCRFFTKEYVAMIDKVRDFYKERQIGIRFEKIYFTHARYGNRFGGGEEIIERYFSEQGYKIIAPEEHKLDELMSMLVNCKAFASTMGSCSHNTLFLSDGTEVILIPRGSFIPGCQVAIDQIHDLNIKYIDSSLSIFTNCKKPHHGPFLYCVSDNLQKYFNDIRVTDDFYIDNYRNIIPYLLSGLKEYDRDYGLIQSVYYREFFIALKRYILANMNYSKRESEYRQRLIDYLSQNPNQKIYIYGCGNFGIKIKRFLQNLRIPIAGFIVSEGYREVDSIDEVPVYEIMEVENVGNVILVAVNKKLQKDIMENLRKKNYSNVYNVFF